MHIPVTQDTKVVIEYTSLFKITKDEYTNLYSVAVTDGVLHLRFVDGNIIIKPLHSITDINVISKGE
jgi:hypothetical protein